jgi:hypothetical protein
LTRPSRKSRQELDTPQIDPQYIQEPTEQWQVRAKREQRKVPLTGEVYTILQEFELFRLIRTTMLEPANSKHLNDYAKGIPTGNDFGTLYLPAASTRLATGSSTPRSSR